MHPNKQKGGAGTANPEHRPNDQKAAEDAITIPRQRGSRHVSGQTHLRFLLVHEHRPGRQRADAWPLDSCPVCGYQSRHSTEWPPPETLWKTCTSCGHRERYATIAVKAGSRTRRSAR